MSRVSDQAADKMERMVEKAASKSGRAAQETVRIAGKGAAIASKTAVNGIVLMISGVDFTRKEIMNALKSVALMKTKDIKFSKRNVSINELKHKGSVKNIDETVKREVMFYFDKNCKKYGVEYNALQDGADDKKYMIFFSGRDEAAIHQVIKCAYRDYTKAEVKKEQKQERRESVRAKLEFFRNRIAANEKNDVGKSIDKDIKPPVITK